MKNFQIFDQNRGLTPLTKCQIFYFLKLMFYGFEWFVFYLERHRRYFLSLFGQKRKDEEISHFSPKPWTNPFGEMSDFQLSYIDVFIVLNGLFSI